MLFPALLMLFALAMEKVQTHIDRVSETVSDEHVDALLTQTQHSLHSDVELLDDTTLPTLDELRSRQAS